MSLDSLRPGDIEDLLAGVHLLGCGGGGNPYYQGLQLRRALVDPVPLIRYDELGDDHVVVIGILGSPDLEYERPPSGQEVHRSLDLLARCTGVTPTVLMPFMIGGDIGVYAAVAAAEAGMPCLDADLVGRAVPRLDLMSVARATGFSPDLAVAWPSGLETFIAGVDLSGTEEAARRLVLTGGGWGAIAMRLPGELVPDYLLTGAYTRAIELGRTVRAAAGPDALSSLAEADGIHTLAAGRVRRVVRTDDQETPTLDALLIDDLRQGAVVRIHGRTEYLLVSRDGRPHATAPDLLMVLEARTLRPIDVTALRAGQDVVVLTADGHPWYAR